MLDITPPESQRTSIVALLAALALHVAFIAVAASLQRASPLHVPAPVTQLFEIEAPAIVQPEPAIEPEAPESPSPSPHHLAARAERPSRPATAAAAAPERSTEPAAPSADTHEVLDFGATVVASTTTSSNTAPSAAGGTGHAQHGSLTVSTLASTANISGAGDRSRAPGLAGGAQWRCPFPIEADAAGIDHAQVTLDVDVANDGSVLSARALDDPGHGFARNARACALRKRLAPALSRAGLPMRANTVIHVTFER